MTVMKYDSGTIDQLVTELKGHHSTLSQSLQDLKQAHSELMSVWQGGGSTECNASAGKMHKACGETLDILSSGINGVSQAHEAAIQTDTGVGRSWQA